VQKGRVQGCVESRNPFKNRFFTSAEFQKEMLGGGQRLILHRRAIAVKD
jgi:hypothetical protein